MSLTNQVKVIYDGQCAFCLACIKQLTIMDLFKRLCYVNLHHVDLKQYHLDLTHSRALMQMHVIESNGRLYGGFDAFRRLCWHVPLLYPMLLLVYLPGMKIIGGVLYRMIAKNRFRVCNNKSCCL